MQSTEVSNISLFKNKLSQVLLENKAFFVSLLFIWVAVGIVLLVLDHGDEFYYFDEIHCPFLDFFFRYNTYLADGLVQAILLLPLLFLRIRIYGLFVLAHLSSGAFVQIIKRIFAMPRPSAFFSNVHFFNTVEGVALYSKHSFPSGHTASIFALITLFALLSKSRVAQFALIVLGIVIAFSRMYLLQHFLLDVYFGSMIGTAFSTVIYAYYFRNKSLDVVKSSIREYINSKRANYHSKRQAKKYE